MYIRFIIFLFTSEAEPSSPPLPLGALGDVELLVVNHRGVEAEGGAGDSDHGGAGRHEEQFWIPLSLVVMVVLSTGNADQD